MSDAPEAIALSDTLQKLAADFVLTDDGRFLMPDEAYGRWSWDLAKLPEAERIPLIKELLALGMKAFREGGDAAEVGISQLCYLSGVLLVSEEKAAQLFGAMGLDVKPEAFKNVTGAAAPSNRPVGGGERPEGATSPLGARFTKK